jgi:hypothetical protein
MRYDGSNHKNRKGVWHFANVNKQSVESHHKKLANRVDNQSTFNSACVVRSSVTDGTFIDRDAEPWEIFAKGSNSTRYNGLSRQWRNVSGTLDTLN